MTDFSRSAVDTALARRLEQAIDKMDAEPATAKSFPLQIAKAMIRSVVRALRTEPSPAPVRKLAVVGRYEDSPSLRQSDEQIERKYLDATDPRPKCEAEKGEVPDAG